VTQAIAVSILALTVGLSLSRPRIGWLQIRHAAAAVIGVVLSLVTGILPVPAALDALRLLRFPIVTIASLMLVTLTAEQAGLFDLLARRLARDAKGSGWRLLAFLFLGGTVLGTVFTNDAAVLIFTPLVFHLAQDVRDEAWAAKSALPFYFAVLYVGNLVGALVISNPINIVVSSVFGIRFTEYARWMILPALVSIVVSFAGLAFFFRKQVPETYRVPAPPVVVGRRRRFLIVCTAVLALTLVGFFTEEWTGFPPWLVAFTGALLLLGLHAAMNGGRPGAILKGVGWDVLIFLAGIFLIVRGLREAGLTANMAALLQAAAGKSLPLLTLATGLMAAISSAVINNHPTAHIMSHVLASLHLPPFETKMAVFSALVGGDLGPKMLPIGSLAALIWFRILRDKGVQISYRTYIAIGIPVTLAAVVLSILTLNLEIAAVQAFAR
jgi:arsenical pump membrane protein